MKFTMTNLKKELGKKTKKELVQEISALCQKFPQVREYYKMQTDAAEDVRSVMKHYKNIIEKEFVDGKTRGNPKARFSVAKKAVDDFKKLTKNPELIADMMLTYVESISDFNSDFFPDSEEFYVRPVDMFEDVLKFLEKKDLLDKFQKRAYLIVVNADDNYGFCDCIQDRYEEVYGELEE